MIDGCNREINYARISLTDKCNFRCLYCMPECGIEKKEHSEIISLEDMFTVIKVLSELGIKKVRFTGGEPLVRKGAIDLIERVHEELPSIENISITTNGVFLPSYIDRLKKVNLSSVNISIDSFNEDDYRKITRGGNLKDALEGLKCAKEANIDKIKLNAVLLKGINDDKIKDFADFGRENNVEVRFIELMPFSYGNSYDEYGISASEVIENNQLTKIEKLTFTNNTEYYTFKDGTQIGFIRPLSHKFCEYCNRIRITADGKMLLCLHRTEEIDLKGNFDRLDALKYMIREGIINKPKCHNLTAGEYQNRYMNRIGG